MKYVGLYHLNAYTYPIPRGFRTWSEMRQMFQRVTKGSLSGKAGEPAKETSRSMASMSITPEKGVVGIPFFDGYLKRLPASSSTAASTATESLRKDHASSFFSVNFNEGAPSRTCRRPSSNTSPLARASMRIRLLS